MRSSFRGQHPALACPMPRNSARNTRVMIIEFLATHWLNFRCTNLSNSSWNSPKPCAIGKNRMMQEMPPDIIRLAYGLTYFALGLAVGVRALAYPTSGFRDRIFALAAFGLLQAGAIWSLSALPLETITPSPLMGLVYAPGYLALYYFAFGWREKWPILVHAVVFGTVGVLAAVAMFVADPVQTPLWVELGVAVPASFCAALALIFGNTFRLEKSASAFSRLGVAAGFLIYAALIAIFATASVFPAARFNPADLTAALGLTPELMRAMTIVAVAIGFVSLLNRFDAAMRTQLEECIAAIEEAHAAAKANLKRASDVGNLGTWEWNIATGKVHWAEQTYRIYGLNPREMQANDTTYFEAVHPEDRAAVKEEMKRVLKYCKPYNSEHRILRPNDSVRHVRVHAKVDVGADGSAHKLLGVTCDITELVEAKNAVLAAKAAAEASNTAKSNFMANMSHELRTPLNAILGFSEIMEAELYGPHSNPLYRSYANDIRKSGQHLLSVINDILTVSRCEIGKIELHEEAAINVEEMITKCMKWVECQAADGAVELRTIIAPGLPALRGDPRLLVQALLNLITNAVKFTPRDGVVEVSAGENSVGGIALSVRDTGIGMNAEQIERIGEPFLQFDDSRSRRFEGTGLGLVIAKRLLELHAGKLDVQSTPNGGSTFSINFPPGRSVRNRTRQLRSWGNARAS
nr:MAG: PAS domain S-box protein [Hyphomicrobiales bacterium]